MEDLTCDSMDLLGIPLVSDSPGELDDDSSLANLITKTTKVKIALIDSFSHEPILLDEYNSFIREPILRPIHDCTREIKLSGHGFHCASILAGKPQNPSFYGLRTEGKVRGIIPDAELYVYPTGCEFCGRRTDFLIRAINEAVKEGVKVISMSQGSQKLTHDDFKIEWNFEDDVMAQTTLEAFKNNVLVCVPAGNIGPAAKSLVYGYPWIANVGACTTGKILIANVTIARKGEDEKEDEENFITLDNLEGISMNIVESPFLPLKIDQRLRIDKEGILYAHPDSIILMTATEGQRNRFCNLIASANARVCMSRDNCKKILEWESKPETIYVRISKSTQKVDGRGIYVPEFSSRGPSRFFEEIMMPDFVAPGCNILASHPKNVSLEIKGKPLFNSQRMITGTSMATPHVAGLFALIRSIRPDWSVAVAKSAAATTAWSFQENGVSGDVFMYGAGSIQLERALYPGLVFDITYEDHLKFAKRELESHDLNMPSFVAIFTQSHEICERIFHREMINIDNTTETYTAKVYIHQNNLDKKAVIDVFPEKLTFEPRQVQKFTLKVRLYPCPLSALSGALIWTNSTGERRVMCHISLYRSSSFDRIIWYKDVKDTKREEERVKESIEGNNPPSQGKRKKEG